jgi:hypothetical protein
VYNRFNPRDIDIVLVGPHEFLIEIERDEHLKGRVLKNSFGGYKIISEKCVFDIWHISDTWAFKEKLVEQSIENLLKTVFLNIDAYAYNLTKQYFIGNCNNKGLPKLISIVLFKNPNLSLNFIRALALSKKYKIGFSDYIKSIIIQEVNNAYSKELFISNLIKEQERHYNEVIVSFNEISILISEFQNSNWRC